MLPNSTQLDFAEFFVGGLLDKSKKEEFYMFHVGVRELLQENLSPYKSVEILERNSKFIAKNFGSSLNFSAMFMNDLEDDEWTEADKRFADMSLSTLERLGGNYSKEAKRIRQKRFGLKEKVEVSLVTPTTKHFTMGSNEYSFEKPIHEVILNYDFEISPYLVTFEEYDIFCEDKEYLKENNLDIEKPKDEGWGREKRPVINVSWNDADIYCKWLSKKTNETYRLPTEAEWEYACRAGSTTKWHFGDDENKLKDYAWYSENSEKKTHPVGEKKPNDWGLFDMYGNVWEWCLDDFEDNYNNTPRDGTEHIMEKKEYKSLRGGSWGNDDYYSRSADRFRNYPADRYSNVGFRLLRTLP